MIFGIAEVTGAMAAGALYDAQHHRLYLFLMFFLIILPFAMCVGLELNSTSSIGMHDAEIMLPMVAAALFGLADSMASVCAYALVAELFEIFQRQVPQPPLVLFEQAEQHAPLLVWLFRQQQLIR